MGKFIDRTGQRYGRLVAIRRVGTKDNKAEWLCRCDCGREARVVTTSINAGTKSCGCLQREATRRRNTTHGLSRAHAETYKVWKDMKSRCYNAKNKDFKDYGARGITVCEEWKDDFGAFFACMGDRPVGKTIDRERVNEGYSPGNCRWADIFEQANNKRNNHVIEFQGQSKTLAAWSRETGIESSLLRYRLQRGWPLERVFDGTDARKRPRN
jgi:hypothetical protein